MLRSKIIFTEMHRQTWNFFYKEKKIFFFTIVTIINKTLLCSRPVAFFLSLLKYHEEDKPAKNHFPCAAECHATSKCYSY